MKELNFRTLETLKVPDELMKSLLSIPEAGEKKSAAVPLWRNRAAIAAASLVFVGVLSLLMLFHGFDSVFVAPHDSGVVQPQTNAFPGEVSAEETVDSPVTELEETLSEEATEYTAVTDEQQPTFIDLRTESANTPRLIEATVPAGLYQNQAIPNPVESDPHSYPASVKTDPSTVEPTDSAVIQNPTRHTLPSGYVIVSFSVRIDASLITDDMVYGWVKELDDNNREVKTYTSDHQIHYRFLNDETALIIYDAEIEQAQGTKTYAYLFYNERGEVLASGTQVIDFSP